MITTMVKPIFSILVAYPLRGRLDGGFERLAGVGLGRAQPGFELAEGEFDGVEIGRVGRRTRPR